jgi:DNA-binding transcriptional LysR family regulator
LFPDDWGVRTLSDLAVRERGIEPRYAFEVVDTSTLFDFVEVSLGVAVLPDALAELRRDGLRQVAISGRRWTWAITAQTHAPRPDNPAAPALWAMLGERVNVDVGRI